MPPVRRRVRPADSGQASVELVAALPALLLIGALAWQLALAGHAAWACANAARVAARADLVGRDPRVAARTALPRHLRRGLRVEEASEGRGIRVRVRVPLLLPGRSAPVSIAATAALGGGG